MPQRRRRAHSGRNRASTTARTMDEVVLGPRRNLSGVLSSRLSGSLPARSAPLLPTCSGSALSSKQNTRGRCVAGWRWDPQPASASRGWDPPGRSRARPLRGPHRWPALRIPPASASDAPPIPRRAPGIPRRACGSPTSDRLAPARTHLSARSLPAGLSALSPAPPWS